MFAEECDVVICRACMRECMDDYRSIHRREVIQDESTTLASMLSYCTNLDFSEHKNYLPGNLCDDCIQNLIKLYAFKQTVIKSDEAFRNQYSKLFDEKPPIERWQIDHNADELQDTSSDQEHSIDHLKYLKLEIEDPQEEEVGKASNSEGTSKESGNNSYNKEIKSTTSPDSPALGQYTCNVCGKFYLRPTSFRKHMITHIVEKPYKCEVCDRGFKRRSAIKMHMLTHSAEGQFPCDVCGVKFRSPSNLSTHKRIHTGEKTFGCKMCDKRFRTSGQLLYHNRVHTGEKPYSCEICNKSFSRRYDVTRHRMGTHNKKVVPDMSGS